jgi:hypothetical protein
MPERAALDGSVRAQVASARWMPRWEPHHAAASLDRGGWPRRLVVRRHLPPDGKRLQRAGSELRADEEDGFDRDGPIVGLGPIWAAV